MPMRAVYTIFGFLDVWGHLPVNFFLKDDLGWSPSQVQSVALCQLFDGVSIMSPPRRSRLR